MDPIERAIRSALEKGDARAPAFREKVYRSAFAALDRVLKANPGMTVEKAIARRKTLQARIADIEAGFLRPPAPEPDWAPADRAPATRPEDAAAPRRASRFFGGRKDQGARVEPRLDAGPDAGPDGRRAGSYGEDGDWPDVGTEPDAGRGTVAPDPDLRRAKRARSRLGSFAAAIVILLALVGTGWWVAINGLPSLGGGARTADGTPPRTVADELAAGERSAPLGVADAGGDWINIFSPEDPSTVSSPSGAEAAVQSAEGTTFLRVRSGEGDAAVSFDVGQGILEKLAGRKATFDIVARAEANAETEFSVECNFGALGDCGRKRYAATSANHTDFLFEVEFPAQRPAAGGTISVDSDVTDGGKAVDIYEIRVSATE